MQCGHRKRQETFPYVSPSQPIRADNWLYYCPSRQLPTIWEQSSVSREAGNKASAPQMPGNYTSAPLATCRRPCANERSVVWNPKSSGRWLHSLLTPSRGTASHPHAVVSVSFLRAVTCLLPLSRSSSVYRALAPWQHLSRAGV